MEEYKNLCIGVLNQAIEDLTANMPNKPVIKKDEPTEKTIKKLCNFKSAKIRQEKIKVDAFKWFTSKEDHTFSFVNICILLNIDAKRVKNKIFKQSFPTLINL